MIRDHIQVHYGIAGRSRPKFARDSRLPRCAFVYAVVCSTAMACISIMRPEFVTGANAMLVLVIALSVAVSLACAGQWYVHRLFSGSDFVQHNEVGGFIIAIVGALYATLLGFLTVITWQHFLDARDLVAVESSSSADVWHAAVGLPYAERWRVRQDMLDYATSMVKTEWPLMRVGGFDTKGDVFVMDAISAAGSFKPANLMEADSQVGTLQQLGVLHDARQRRIDDNASGISWFEWVVLLIGAGCVVGFCWLFGLANASVHLVMTSAVTIIMVSTLVLLFELQYPFRTDLRIGSDAWVGVINHIHFMQSGPGSMRM